MAATTAAIATAAILGGAAVSALGESAQGRAGKAEANFSAAIQKQQAANTQQVAAVNERDFRRQQSRVMAARRAARGASGVSSDTGSPLLADADMAREIELQAQRIRYGGQVESQRLNQQAALTKMAGKNAEQAGYLRAGSSLLTGFGRAYG